MIDPPPDTPPLMRWTSRPDFSYISDAGYVIYRVARGNWVSNRSDAEPIPGFNRHSTLAIAKHNCERDRNALAGSGGYKQIPRTRVGLSLGDPGKWQAQYYDPDLEIWCDIGDAQAVKTDAQSREWQYIQEQRRVACDGCGAVHPISTMTHERIQDMGSSESDYRCPACGPLNHQRITSPTAARRAELSDNQ